MPESVASALANATAMLRPHSGSARADAELLLAEALGRDRAFVFAHGEQQLDDVQASRFYGDCERRMAGVPVAYLLGHAGFYGRSFVVDERVLVPRPETEALVDSALQFARGRDGSPLRVLDVGTGSGALACTLAAELPGAHVDATDISEAALAVARHNARTLGVERRCGFYCGDLTAPVAGRSYDVVVANLPYVSTADIPPAPDPLAFEPRIALDGGTDGVRAYARLLMELPALVSAGGLALLEAAPPQMERLIDLSAAAFPKAAIAVEHDLGGLERFVAIEVAED